MTPVRIKDMMEMIDIKDCFASLPDGAVSKVVGVNSTNKGVLSSPETITNTAGCGRFTKSLTQGKWYRIAIGAQGSSASSALFNIGKNYINTQPSSQLFFIHADGYSNNSKVVELIKAGTSIYKIRILKKENITDRTMLDIYIVGSSGTNLFTFCYSCNIGFTFQSPVEVAASDIPSGYTVDEFTF